MKKVVNYRGVILVAILVSFLWLALVVYEEEILRAFALSEDYQGRLLEGVIIIIVLSGLVLNGYYDRKKRALFGEEDYQVVYFRQPWVRVIYGLLSGAAIVAYIISRQDAYQPFYGLLSLPGMGVVSLVYGRYYYNDQRLVVQNWVITIDEIEALALVTNDFGRKILFTVKDQKKAVDFVSGEKQIGVYQWLSGRLES